MTIDRTLTDKPEPWARAILPDAVLERERAVDAVIELDATVNPEALASSVSIPIHTGISGSLSAANDVAPRRYIPQAATIWQVRAIARTGPSANNSTTLWLVADGQRIIQVNIAEGRADGVSPDSVDVDPGTLLTVDCTVPGGASDVDIMIAIRPRGRR